MKFNLETVVSDILRVMPDAVEIWFHGSRARGDHKPNSDYDILVLYGEGVKKYDTVMALRPLNPPPRYDEKRRAELDIQSDPISDKDVPNTVAYWASQEGRLLYATPAMEPVAPSP